MDYGYSFLSHSPKKPDYLFWLLLFVTILILMVTWIGKVRAEDYKVKIQVLRSQSGKGIKNMPPAITEKEWREILSIEKKSKAKNIEFYRNLYHQKVDINKRPLETKTEVILMPEEIDICIDCIIEIESGGNSLARSENNCIGLMQVSPIVLKEYRNFHKDNFSQALREDSLLHPEINKLIGIWYLNRIKNHYLPYYKIPVTIENVCIAYNFGIGNLVKWYRAGAKWEKLPKETQNYIKKYHKLAKSK